MISVSNPDTIEELVHLSTIIKSKENKKGIYALNIINEEDASSDAGIKANKILEKAVITASATDIQLHKLLRYDINITNGITGVIKEHDITDLVLGLHVKKGISESFLGKLTEGILTKCNVTTFVYKPAQPISTIKRHLIVVPKNAEKEIGFPFWLSRIWNIPRNTGAKILFYANQETIAVIKGIQLKYPIDADFKPFEDWNDFLIIARDIRLDDNLIILLSRANKLSFHAKMANIPSYLNKYFQKTSFILIYPMQMGLIDKSAIDLNYPSLLEPIEKLDEIGRNIARLFKRK